MQRTIIKNKIVISILDKALANVKNNNSIGTYQKNRDLALFALYADDLL